MVPDEDILWSSNVFMRIVQAFPAPIQRDVKFVVFIHTVYTIWDYKFKFSKRYVNENKYRIIV